MTSGSSPRRSSNRTSFLQAARHLQQRSAGVRRWHQELKRVGRHVRALYLLQNEDLGICVLRLFKFKTILPIYKGPALMTKDGRFNRLNR
jgi:hypothetical protein